MNCKEYCVNWPPPNLDCLPCLPAGIQPDRFCELLEEANETVFEYSNRCYTGCDCWTELQICSSSCPCQRFCNCDPCFIERIDLSYFLCQPVHEVLEVKINGKPIQDLSDWVIQENCFLVCPPYGWPAQYLADGPESDCSWTIKVRHGTPPPKRLVRLRDEYFFDLIKDCFPSKNMSCSTEGITKLVTKSGTYEFKNQEDILSKISCEYGPSPMGMSRFTDPGNPDNLYKVIEISKGSTEDSGFDCEQLLLDWVEESNEPDLPEPKLVTGKLYNKLGQPIQ